MKKFVTFLSGIYLAIFGTFQLVRIMPRYDFIINQPSGIHRIFLAVNFVLFSFFGLVCAVLGIGMIYRKEWARELLVVISFFSVSIGLTIAICMACLYFMVPYGELAIGGIYDVFYWVYVWMCLIIIPYLFRRYFSKEKF